MAKEKKEKKEKPEKKEKESKGSAAKAGKAAKADAAKKAPALPKARKKKKKKYIRTPRVLLSPLIPIYRTILDLRELRFSMGLEKIDWLKYPVISVGNLSTGGTGKTPFTIALAQQLAYHELPVDVLSRGYGRKTEGVLRVNPEGSAEEYGDEPLLIAREANVPVYVAAKRYEAGLLAEQDAIEMLKKASKGNGEEEDETMQMEVLCHYRKQLKSLARPQKEEEEKTFNPFSGRKEEVPTRGEEPEEKEPGPACIHLLDDGFQHRNLMRTANILLLNQQDWDDRLLPGGNMREPHEAIFRAHTIAIPAEEPELEDKLDRYGWRGPVWKLRRKMEVKQIEGPVVAFCGIARSDQFFDGLAEEGIQMVEEISCPDHYHYSRRFIDEMIASARLKGAKAIITTGKDYARLGKLVERFPEYMPLHVARLTTEIVDRPEVLAWLAERLL